MANKKSVGMFQRMDPMKDGSPAALRRTGKTAADRARLAHSKLSGKSRAEVLTWLEQRHA